MCLPRGADYGKPPTFWIPPRPGAALPTVWAATWAARPPSARPRAEPVPSFTWVFGDAFDSGVGGFVVKSSDAGNTWSSAIQLTGTVGATTYTATKILDLKVDDTGVESTNVVLVGTNVGLFRSTNAGASYSLVNNATFNGHYAWSLVRTGTNTWIASTEDFLAGTAGSILRSTDGGANWNPISGPIAGAGRMTLGIGTPGDSDVYCFAATTGDGAQLDLYRSANGGQSWTATNTNGSTAPRTRNTANPDQPDNDYMQGQAFYNHMLLVDPIDTNHNTVYVGGQLSSARNTNGGATGSANTDKWRVLTNWLAQYNLPYSHADFHCAATSDAGGTHRIFFGNDGGLFISTDAGITWDDKKNVGHHLPPGLRHGHRPTEQLQRRQRADGPAGQRHP